MAPMVQKSYQEFIESIPDSKIDWKNYAHGESHKNVFQNNLKKDTFRMDLQKFSKDPEGPNPNDNYYQLAVQLNREGGAATSKTLRGDLKDGSKGPVYGSLKIHCDGQPDAQTFKGCLLMAGKDCQEKENGQPKSYCVQIERDASWRNHTTGETGQGKNFQPPNVKPAAAFVPAAQNTDQSNNNSKGKGKGKK
ncbi:hypothetical protein GTA08_BOTSDO07995 [Botryosphaeria dothidea]|uniref:Uncharacterized protein n=1 Tax=Botryosphaeria dothidea TaxID=55169 RepID=A0A8H4N0K6_9PEZI|nr:hypothetical protein GTA08_BOTSDO07995 [Botryosphaeria dothidea]